MEEKVAGDGCLLFNHYVGSRAVIGGCIDVESHDDDGSVPLIHACPQNIQSLDQSSGTVAPITVVVHLSSFVRILPIIEIPVTKCWFSQNGGQVDPAEYGLGFLVSLAVKHILF